MRELKCPSCGHMNPDIRELGYTLPFTCNACPHIWRLQDFADPPAPERSPISGSEYAKEAPGVLHCWKCGDVEDHLGSCPVRDTGCPIWR